MSDSGEFNWQDVKHVAVHGFMTIIAVFMTMLSTEGLSWSSVGKTAIASTLFVLQSASHRWLSDNHVTPPPRE